MPVANEDKAVAKRHLWLFLLASVVILGFWAGFALVAYPLRDTLGTFGDSFGALNTLFSGLAFSALVIALLMQKDDLGLQLRELTRSSNALDETAKANQAAAEAAQEQLRLSAQAIERSESNARAQLVSTFRARIVVGLQWRREGSRKAWRLVVQNVGQSTATNLRMRVTSGVIGIGTNDGPSMLTSVPLFGGSERFSLPPQQGVTYELDDGYIMPMEVRVEGLDPWQVEAVYEPSIGAAEVTEVTDLNPRLFVYGRPQAP
jgi:hypothetical protein